MGNKDRMAVVTGGNRGIGLEVCRQLAKKGYHVILTARDPEQGLAAAESLKAEGLGICFQPVDVTDPDSVQAVYERLAKNHGHLEVLVNNAGVMLDPHENPSIFEADPETIRKTFEINTLGPLMVTRTFLPILKKSIGARIVNVSSGMGQLSDMNGGYPGYRFSKVSLNALTRIMADELQGTKIKVNSACPGWVKTGMGGENAPRTVEEGADTIVWLATLPEDGPTGGFFRNRERMDW